MRHLTELHAIHAELWQQLASAASGMDHPWPTPVLATFSQAGLLPKLVAVIEATAAAAATRA